MKRNHKENGLISCTLYSTAEKMLFLTKKDHQDQTKNAKVIRFQNFQNFVENFSQFLGYAVCWGENYEREKSFQTKNFAGEFFFWDFIVFFENIFGDHFYISKFEPLLGQIHLH